MTRPTPATIAVLHELADALRGIAPVDVGTMFNSPGIRTNGTIVAFLDGDDRLIVKVPRSRAVALIERGTVEPVTMGKRTMREWVIITADTNADLLAAWLPLATEALRYSRGLRSQQTES